MAQWRGTVGFGAAVMIGVGLVACGSDPAGEPSDGRAGHSSDNSTVEALPSGVVAVDSSATMEDPVTIELDGLSASFFYGTTGAYRVESGEPVLTDELSPIMYWRFTVPEGEPPKDFRAKVQLLYDGEPIDAYYSLPDVDGGVLRNEMFDGDIDRKSASGLSPEDSDQRGRYALIGSGTGTDFEFRLSEMTVSDTSAEEIASRPTPPFDPTPEGQFNKLAYEKGWVVPPEFVVTEDATGKPINRTYASAAAIQALIKKVNDLALRSAGATSPTQAFAEWMRPWNPEMLAAGIEMLGDEQIQETYRRAQAGDIDIWFRGDGTWIVGTEEDQIPPGTYRATATPGTLITDGYWERTSSSGEIIDNAFVTSAREITVTIGPTDGQFRSSHIGVPWKPVK
ncbi:hypothetical protein ACWECW_18375 [Rhodococcus ruber]